MSKSTRIGSFSSCRVQQLVLILCIAATLSGCASAATPQPTLTQVAVAPSATTVQTAAPVQTSTAQAANSDPFAYCNVIGTIDAPDARYTGEKMPMSIVEGMVKAGLVADDAPQQIKENAVWRCMDNSVWVCPMGANIPCDEKADTSQTPSAALTDFCQANPSADVIPATVSGRTTIYEWHCQAGKPVVGKQVLHADAQGFIADFWHSLATTTLPSQGVVVTIRVADKEQYKIRLTDPADIEIARKLLAGEEAPSIPNGVVLRGDPDVNTGYHWHIDPATLEFADMTTEVCDGLPSDVEQGTITSDRYCPWSAKVIAIGD